jgi:hypothetical protein
VDWDSIAKLSQEAFRVAVNEWIGAARIQGGTVSGPNAILPPGSLVSTTNIEARMTQTVAGSQVPRDIASALSNTLAAAWKEWASGFQLQIPAAYPKFAAIPGPAAPPTPTSGATPLSKGAPPANRL